MAEQQTRDSQQHSDARLSFQSSNTNIFSDDFALEPLGLTDGRETTSPNTDGSHDAISATSQRPVSFLQNVRSMGGSIRRSRQSLRSDGGSSISSDDRPPQSSRPRSVTSVTDSVNTASTPHRSVRTISTFGFTRAQSPYQGATGPSQPYGMYPQDIDLARTPSAATASTIRQPERSYSGPSGPTQPYGMYAQNTVPEDHVDVVPGLANPIVAGFHGSGHSFQRRLGPDREDVDDLIGPDGYTEQLPPYSRYANGVPPKYASGVGSVHRGPAPPPPSLQPPLEHMPEVPNSPQPTDTAPVNPFGDSSTQLGSDDTGVVPPKDEGGNFKERLRRRSKRKVCCGVSCRLCIVILVVVFFAILLGGIIGGVLAHKHGEEKGLNNALAAQTVTAGAPTATVTQLSPPPDAIFVPSPPSNLPALPTGTYAVTLDEAIVSTNSCLTDSAQVSAWDCATGAQLTMEVSMIGSKIPMISLSDPRSPVTPIRYGAQPPELNGPANLLLYKDKDELDKGAAYFFWKLYNKTVIVHESDLPGGLPGSKRSFSERWVSDDEGLADSQWPSNSIAQPADKPWYCIWPQTVLEGFIFVSTDVEEESTESATSSNTAVSTAASVIPKKAKRGALKGLQPYPKLVKIEERRNYQNPVSPYCQQMQILNNNQPGPLSDPATGELIQIQLTESEIVQHQVVPVQQIDDDATADDDSSSALDRRRAVERRGRAGKGPLCHCEWKSN